jgi:putative phosphoribosyl transferase
MMSALFQDRKQAGEELAIVLKEHLTHSNGDFNKWDNTKLKESLLVLTIPRGGVVLGDIIASNLRCNLDVIFSKKIGAPSNKEFAIGAVMPDGSFFLNELRFDMLGISQNYIQKEIEGKKKEMERRLKEIRGMIMTMS